MEEKDYVFLCKSLAKSTSAGVRIYYKTQCRTYYSVYPLLPDPVAPFLPQLLNPCHRAGVITTPLYQLYGFLQLAPNWRIIIGPTKIEDKNPRLLEEQLFLLGVAAEQKDEYIRTLLCAPIITAERMAWTIVFLATLAQQKAFSVDDLYVNVQAGQTQNLLNHKDLLQGFDSDESLQELTMRSFEFEKLLISYIKHGEPEKIKELINALPNISVGQMAKDTVRQIKNSGICAATLASRAAIAGGMDSPAAFRLSDLYIQKIELLQDISSLQQLCSDIFTHYAQQVQQIKYPVLAHSDTEKMGLFLSCADYVSKNIYNSIRAEDIAQALGYSRTYLCHKFKCETKLTLTQYILQEKVLEAQRMLEFTDKSLCEIASLFSFSSQSHFQTVFKQINGKTPMQYRQHKQNSGKAYLEIHKRATGS